MKTNMLFTEFMQRKRRSLAPASALRRRRRNRSSLEQGRNDGRTDDSESKVNGASKLFFPIRRRKERILRCFQGPEGRDRATI